MIGATYAISGVLLAITGWLFARHLDGDLGLRKGAWPRGRQKGQRRQQEAASGVLTMNNAEIHGHTQYSAFRRFVRGRVG